MERQDKYFLLEIILTAGLLGVPALLLRQQLALLAGILFLSWSCGFVFSWFLMRDRSGSLHGAGSALGILAVAAWMIVSTMNSAMTYREVSLIALKGVFFCTAVLTFFVNTPAALSSIQYLTLPVFMGQALFHADFTPVEKSLVLLYLVLWALLLKLKFLTLAEERQERPVIPAASTLLLVFLFTAGLMSAIYVWKNIPIKKQLAYRGYLLEDRPDDSGANEEYIKDREELQGEIIEAISRLKEYELRREAMTYLGELVKEASSAYETDKAADGLISLFKSEGPGTGARKSDIGLTQSINGFRDKKMVFQQKKAGKDLLFGLKKGPLGAIFHRFSLSRDFGKMQEADSRREKDGRLAAMDRRLQSAPLDKKQKDDIREAAHRAADWKSLELYRKTMSTQEKTTPGKADTDSGQKKEKSVEDIKKEIRGILSGEQDRDLLRKLDELSRRSDPSGIMNAADDLQREADRALGPEKREKLRKAVEELKESVRRQEQGQSGKSSERRQLEEQIRDILSGASGNKERELQEKMQELSQKTGAEEVRAAANELMRMAEGALDQSKREELREALEKLKELAQQQEQGQSGKSSERRQLEEQIRDILSGASGNKERELQEKMQELSQKTGAEEVRSAANELMRMAESALDQARREELREALEKLKELAQQQEQGQSGKSSERRRLEEQIRDILSGASGNKERELQEKMQELSQKTGAEEVRSAANELMRMAEGALDQSKREELREALEKLKELAQQEQNQGIKSWERLQLEKKIRDILSGAAGNKEKELQTKMQELSQKTGAEEIRSSADELMRIAERSLPGEKREDLRDALEELKRLAERQEKTDQGVREKKTPETAGEAVNSAKDLQDMEKAEQELSRQEKEAAGEAKQNIREMKDALLLKVEMLLRHQSQELERKARASTELAASAKEKFIEEIRRTQESLETAQTIDNVRRMQKSASAAEKEIQQGTDEVSMTRLELSRQEILEQAERLLEDAGKPGEEFRNELERLSRQKTAESVSSQADKLREDIEPLKRNGLIHSVPAEELKRSVEGVRDVVLQKIEIAGKDSGQGAKDVTREKQEQPPEGAMEDSGQVIEKVMSSLENAQSLQELSELSSVAQQELSRMKTQGTQDPSRKNQLKALQERIEETLETKRRLFKEKNIAQLREKIAELAAVDAREAQRLEEKLKDTPMTEEELAKDVSKLEKELNAEAAAPKQQDALKDVQAADEKIASLQAQLKDVEQRIRQLERRLVQTDAEREKVLEQLREATAQRRELEQQLSELMERREQLAKEVDAAKGQREQIEEQLSDAQLQKQRLMQTSSEAEQEGTKAKTEQEPGEAQLQIHILPPRLIMPVGTTAPLKALLVQNTMIVKDISGSGQWFSEDPAVARIDREGVVYATGKGVTNVALKFRNARIKKVTVVVAEQATGYMRNIGEFTK